MEKGSVHILIQRDASNFPFAKVLYNGQDAFNLDQNMKNFAGYLSRKSTTAHADEGLIFTSTETGEVLEANQVDRLMDFGYCISGSKSGRQYVENLISTVCFGANNQDIGVPVFVTDGNISPIFVNEEAINVNYNQVDISTRHRQEAEKNILLDSILTGSNISHDKRV